MFVYITPFSGEGGFIFIFIFFFFQISGCSLCVSEELCKLETKDNVPKGDMTSSLRGRLRIQFFLNFSVVSFCIYI